MPLKNENVFTVTKENGYFNLDLSNSVWYTFDICSLLKKKKKKRDQDYHHYSYNQHFISINAVVIIIIIM